MTPPSPSCAGGSSTSVRADPRATSSKSAMRATAGAKEAGATCGSGPSTSSVRRSEARSRGPARRKRTFCAMRSRSKQPRSSSRIAVATRMLVEQRLHGILARHDGVAIDQRREDPARKHTRTHRRLALVKRREQRCAGVRTLRARKLQMLCASTGRARETAGDGRIADRSMLRRLLARRAGPFAARSR